MFVIMKVRLTVIVFFAGYLDILLTKNGEN